MRQMVRISAEIEGSLIKERTLAGREAVAVRGVRLGRKPCYPLNWPPTEIDRVMGKLGGCDKIA